MCHELGHKSLKYSVSNTRTTILFWFLFTIIIIIILKIILSAQNATA